MTNGKPSATDTMAAIAVLVALITVVLGFINLAAMHVVRSFFSAQATGAILAVTHWAFFASTWATIVLVLVAVVVIVLRSKRSR